MPGSRDTRRRMIACLFCMLMGWQCCVLALSEARWISEGDKVRKAGYITMDYTNASQGYVMIKTNKTKSKMKLRIILNQTTYTYDINGEGVYETYPLQMGDGKYRIQLYKQVSGKNYTRDTEIALDVKLADEYAPFLYPNQYVNYTEDSPAVAASYEICKGLKTDKEKLEAITSYMSKGFVYDYVRSLTIGNKAYLGDIDGCFQKRMGLCQDLAAVAACMLRVQGIPTQLVIGYADETYHAWNNVLIDGEYQRLDITAVLSHMRKDTEYTTDRIY